MLSTAHADDLTINIQKIRSDHGKIMLGISNSPDSFKTGSWLTSVMAPAKTGSMRVTVPELAAGAYAISVFHDENGDGKLDKNILGIPTEGYAFSNNARSDLGPPSFAAAAFTLPLSTPVLTIDLGY